MTPHPNYASPGELNPIPSWLQLYINYSLSSARPPGAYNWDYFKSLNRLMDEIVQVDHTNLGLVPIYTLNRRSHMVTNKDGQSFFLFDCFHSSMIRMLYYLVAVRASQEQVIPFLKEHIALCLLSEGKVAESILLRDENIPFVYFNSSPESPHFYHQICAWNQKHLPKIPVDQVLGLIDVVKYCHEIYHFLKASKFTRASPFFEVAESQFHSALTSLFPEHPSGKDVKGMVEGLQSIGVLRHEHIGDENHELIKWCVDRRATLIKNADSLIEEIACDMFALRAVVFWRLNAQNNGSVPSWDYSDTFACTFLIVHLIRLIDYFSDWASDLVLHLTLNSENIPKVNLEHTTAFHVRAVCLYDSALSLVEQIAKYPQLVKGIEFSTSERRLLYGGMRDRLAGIKVFLDTFMEVPMTAAFRYLYLAVRAKLADEKLSTLYKEFAGILNAEQRAHYIKPVIEDFLCRDYFLSESEIRNVHSR